MLSHDQLYILHLLRKSISQDRDPDDPPENLEETKKYVLRCGVLLTVYNHLPPELQASLAQPYFSALKQRILQDREGERILQALSGAGLDCIALKGWELRNLYPNPAMRQMADLDILIRPYDYGRIRDILGELGFTGTSKFFWKHDSFRKQELHVETHRRLTDDSAAVQEWEREMWTRATGERHLFRMAPEDYYLFHFIHLHKDFLNGSLGLRRLVDTWLLQKLPVDGPAVKAGLEKFGILPFHDRMVRLCRAAMEDETFDEDTELLLQHAFRHGIYGTSSSYKAARIAVMGRSVAGGKIRSLLSAVFLPYHRMKAQFPVLRKWPILLPFCWIRRILYFLRGNIRASKEKLDYQNIGNVEFDEMKKIFKAGGIE